ncbi:YtxH domain-containing protein [Lysinibacillus piscis]|uniref:General stress protein n=1 Tax=Lysinibacillus piscis TaxID=2518931 RepID=A0ABQ5NNB9_9BACI|nr:YtxH domain-containing protein [Lysinibacillus sp. KH24]GLC89876.1 general stress protein [Lysinibacillus sp. KH24]
MKAKPFLVGLAAGIVGGAAAILFSTPQSGQDLRTTLCTNFSTTKEKMSDVRQQTKVVNQSIQTFTNEAKNNIPKIITDLKQSITTFTQEIEPTKNNLQQDLEALQKSISEIEQNIAQFTETKKKTQKTISN